MLDYQNIYRKDRKENLRIFSDLKGIKEYSSFNIDCYECRTGYAIYGKQCKVRTGYFLKTPPDSGATKIPITIKDDDTNFDLAKQTNFTKKLVNLD